MSSTRFPLAENILRLRLQGNVEGLFSRTNFLFPSEIQGKFGSLPNLTQSDDEDAVEGYNRVPNIRPLETLHNSLSLQQFTTFSEKILKMEGLSSQVRDEQVRERFVSENASSSDANSTLHLATS